MLTGEVILAAVLLANPGPLPDLNEGTAAVLMPSLLALSVGAESLDEREVGFTPTDLRERYLSLLNAPHLGELDRFPSSDEVSRMMILNRVCRADLAKRLPIDLFNDSALKEAIGQLDRTHAALGELQLAQSTYLVAFRRTSLQAFRDWIGQAAFDAGELPPAVPPGCLPRTYP